MSEEKRVWRVSCMVCDTRLDLDFIGFRLISKGQAAEFIRKPFFVCGKCGQACRVQMIKV